MKKLSEWKLQNVKVMNENEMKLILGGSGRCAYSTDYFGTAVCIEVGGAAEADFMAGASGWWCCNCKEADKVCGVS